MLPLSSTSGSYCYRSDSSYFVLMFYWIAVQSMVRFAGATCSAVQSASCLQAAATGQLDQLPGAGHCIVKQYVQYTHLCTVTNYQPSIDHCCCAVDAARLLCCRYHQDWYHFRCMDAEDALEINVSDSSFTSAALDLPLMTLLPIILCPLVVIAVCVVCVTKCWCYRYDNNTSSSSSSSSEFCGCRHRCCCCKIVEDKKEKIPRERFGDEDDARAPLQQPPSAAPSVPEVQTTTTSASGFPPPSCLRAPLHPCCASPRRFPTALSSPEQYHHHNQHHRSGPRTICGPSTAAVGLLLEPSAPPLPPGSAPAGDPYAAPFPHRAHFESELFCCPRPADDSQRTNPAAESRDRSVAADDGFFLGAEFYCACAADDVCLAHARAAAACPDCLPPPAYESIHRESRA